MQIFEFLETLIDQTGPHEILRMSGDSKFFYLTFPISRRYLIKLKFDNEVCSGDFYFIIGVKRMTRFERLTAVRVHAHPFRFAMARAILETLLAIAIV